MARSRKPEPAPAPPTGFIASAARLPSPDRKAAGQSQGWQTEAWKLYDQVGELRYLSNWIGNAISRGELHAARRVGNELVPQTDGPGREAMDALYGGPHGQGEMLQLTGTDLTVGGEGYISYRASAQAWDVIATGKVNQDKQGKVTVDYGDGKRTPTSAADLLIRIWTPHPRDPNQADSPTRSNLQTLHQIRGYDDHISVQLASRLTGAGILPLPEEIKFAVPPDMDPEATQADVFMSTLHEAMLAAKENPASPAATVPIVITVPGDLLENLPEEPIRFWSDLDENVVEMREAALRRFAIGMDVPPEVLMGNSDSNHWNAWLSDDAAIKTHLEPRLGVITAGLTDQYLRPAMRGEVPDDELAEWFVIADTSKIRTRPNRSVDARELREMGLLNGKATVREAGLNEEDMMTEEEYGRWLLQRVALGAVTPELTAAALGILGANIDTSLVTPGDVQEQPRHLLPAPADETVTGPPERPDEANEPLAAACEVLVFRALERAGNKLRQKNQTLRNVEVHSAYLHARGDVDVLLDGAWGCATEVLKAYSEDTDEVVSTLDFYVRGLLTQQKPHSPHTLALLLKAWVTHPRNLQLST